MSAPCQLLPTITITQDGTRLFLRIEGGDRTARYALCTALCAAFPGHHQLYYSQRRSRYRLWHAEHEALGHWAHAIERDGLATVVWEGARAAVQGVER